MQVQKVEELNAKKYKNENLIRAVALEAVELAKAFERTGNITPDLLYLP